MTKKPAYNELESELESLRLRLEEFETKELQNREHRHKRLRNYSKLPARLLLGRSLHREIVNCWSKWSDWLSIGLSEGHQWPEHATRNLVATTVVTLSRRILVGFVVASIPMIVLLAQTYLIGNQNRLLSQQTEILSRQIELEKDAIVRVYPESHIRGKNGEFEFIAVNVGAARIANPAFSTGHFHASLGVDNKVVLRMAGAGGRGGSPVVSARSTGETPLVTRRLYGTILSQGDGYTFSLKFFDSDRLVVDSEGLLLIRLTVSYTRIADGTEYEFTRLFYAASQDTLVDVTEEPIGDERRQKIIDEIRSEVMGAGEA